MAKKKPASLDAITITRPCRGPRGRALARGQVLKVPDEIDLDAARYLVNIRKAVKGEDKSIRPAAPRRRKAGGDDGKDSRPDGGDGSGQTGGGEA